MTEQQASMVAEALGGTAWQSGGDVWLVLFNRSDGSVVAISDDVICVYSDQNALEEGLSSTAISLH